MSEVDKLWPLLEWMLERHSIYLSRKNGDPPPWTDDPILQTYKFTNVFRELDRVSVWMRENFVGMWTDEDPELIMFNACLFRRFGTTELAEAVGFVKRYNAKKVAKIAEVMMERGEKPFTAAYNIPNAGLSLPKSVVVTEHTLQPIWDARKHIISLIQNNPTLESTTALLGTYKIWGGTNFMAYEVVSDLRWTKVLCDAKDILTWANPGPGAIRGLNRVFGRDLKAPLKKSVAVEEMQWIYRILSEIWEGTKLAMGSPADWGTLEMREIEHSLCEFDKYLRLKLGEGRVRSKFTPPELR